ALLQAAQMLMARVPPQTEDAFRLIGIGVGRLVPKNQQQDLWA
ncbi:TPA: DNA polymerase IV, partial [Neisseria gonorrhoeae]